MKHYLLLILFSFSMVSLTAQEKHAICGTDDIHQNLNKTDGRYQNGYNETRAFLAKNKINKYKTVTTAAGTEYHVPVVVHVMHTGGAIGSNYNPSVATINALIAQINNGFANTFDDASIAGTFNGVNIPIRFYLAQRSDACAASTGINRVQVTNAAYVANGVGTGGMSDGALKALSYWNDLDYYNIYIVSKINGEDGYTTVGSYTAGYAYYPQLGGSYEQDGMVCLAFAAANPTSTTFIHELGHGFDLAHTFQGQSGSTCPPNGNCSADNDEICDTEPMLASFSCNPSGNNTCTSAPYAGGQWNYMSYNGCTDRFTAGQSARIMGILNSVRTSYKNSAGIDPPPAALPTVIAGPTINPANSSSNTDMGPEYVGFNSIDHTSKGFSFEGSGYNVYIDNTCNQSTTILKDNSYSLTVETSGNTQKAVAYIDWNNDGVFANAAPERIMSSNGAGGSQTHTATVTPPSTVVLNTPLRMRVMSDFGSNPTITPTGQLTYGQAEDFTVTVVGAPLPVMWRSITANLNHKNNIDVRWSTELETNSSIFEVEKSKDGINFFKIAMVEAKGNSFLPSYYNFEDAVNVNGHNYYRIKQTDIDGQSSYSKVATQMIHSNETDIVLFPNPTSGDLFINLTGLTNKQNKVMYTITDLNGKIWTKKEITVNGTATKVTEDMRAMPSGLYFVQLMINGKMSLHKIAKQF